MGVGVADGLNQQRAYDGSHDAGCRKQQREQDAGFLIKYKPKGQGRDKGTHIGLKQIRAHACHIPYVVAYIVSNDSRVAGVVLRDACLYLTHQVSAHVGCLCIDTPAHTGKQGNGGRAQAEAGQDGHIPGDDIKRAHAHQAKANHGHTHDTAAGKCKGQGLAHTGGTGRVGGAAVGADSRAHAQITGSGGENTSNQETSGGYPAAGPKPDDNK